MSLTFDSGKLVKVFQGRRQWYGRGTVMALPGFKGEKWRRLVPTLCVS